MEGEISSTKLNNFELYVCSVAFSTVLYEVELLSYIDRKAADDYEGMSEVRFFDLTPHNWVSAVGGEMHLMYHQLVTSLVSGWWFIFYPWFKFYFLCFGYGNLMIMSLKQRK